MFYARFSLFAIVLFFAVISGHASPWHFSAGLGSRNQTPAVIVSGIGYNGFQLYVQGMGMHQGPNDYWCGVRGSLLRSFFADLPFRLDVGIGGGYEYAEAPNKMHQAINEANEAMYLFPYNYKETGDISLEWWSHLYGFYTQISIPIYRFREHDSKKILWGAGYMVEF